jgi:hypothetical protein
VSQVKLANGPSSKFFCSFWWVATCKWGISLLPLSPLTKKEKKWVRHLNIPWPQCSSLLLKHADNYASQKWEIIVHCVCYQLFLADLYIHISIFEICFNWFLFCFCKMWCNDVSDLLVIDNNVSFQRWTIEVLLSSWISFHFYFF